MIHTWCLSRILKKKCDSQPTWTKSKVLDTFKQTKTFYYVTLDTLRSLIIAKISCTVVFVGLDLILNDDSSNYVASATSFNSTKSRNWQTTWNPHKQIHAPGYPWSKWTFIWVAKIHIFRTCVCIKPRNHFTVHISYEQFLFLSLLLKRND